MKKIIGLDLGTSSIGTCVRNTSIGDNLVDQLEYYSSDIFKSGVGEEKGKEYSFAADRTKHRQSRRLYETRRRRLWATLSVLIKYGYCPLSEESLKRWSTYNKEKKLFREYPIDDKPFQQWIKLDFNGDGTPDYSSPYQLRRELINQQFDFNIEQNRYKLGRALYHIAQRRGFKSSKGETIATQENDSTSEDIAELMKKSETKLSGALIQYMKDKQLSTVGEAFAYLEDEGIRLRNSQFKAVQSQYEEEISLIFNYQEGLSKESDFYKRIISRKKGEGTIFYRKPLKSQKGLVGKCTLEPNRARCPISHPEFEKFRAWSLINNIRYKKDVDDSWIELDIEVKKKLYHDVFTSRVKNDFPFEDVRKYLEKELSIPLVNSREGKTINYKDNQNIAGCPVVARLIRLFGEEWEKYNYQTDIIRHGDSKHSNKKHLKSYTALDIWHICYQADDVEELTEFVQQKMNWDEEMTRKIVRLWSSIQEGYAMLSLKAISNINRMLCEGFKYSDAVMLAKIPDICNVSLEKMHSILHDFKTIIIPKLENEKRIINITNNLIANYKSTILEDRFADHNTSYQLSEYDKEDIIKAIKDYCGENSFSDMDTNEQENLLNGVTSKYQLFFQSHKREYNKLPKNSEVFKEYLIQQFPDIDKLKWDKLYHHSQISSYSPDVKNDECRLGRPNIGGIKNPVVLRTLNILRRKINSLLDKNIIDAENTRVVIETTRGMNDANMRWAIEAYQREREKERKEIGKILSEFYKTREINDNDIDIARFVLEQSKENSMKDDKQKMFKKDISKYKLWLEQGGICMYTGKTINLSNLFDGNAFDIEHTIPRSISFDSSDKNLTICDSNYNRSIKKNQIPTSLPNFEHDWESNGILYTAIKPRLSKWEERVERIQDNIDFWKSQSRKSQEKERKDFCIRQRHLWKMELDYWKGKLERFTLKEVKSGFRNSQLVDTGIITRHAVLFLKSVFTNVDVEKGSVTADFRKMLGIQSIYEKKDRDKHSHHAIDAAILTVIPIAAKRDRMLQLFYEIEETERLINICSKDSAKSLSYKLDGLRRKMMDEIADCHIGNISAVPTYIEENLLANHISFDRTLVPAKKRVRVRGKVVKVKNADGEEVTKWAQGDCIRGRLHNESYYGAIKIPVQDENGKPKNEDGHFIYDENKENISMVIRQDIKSFTKKEEFEKIIDPSLRSIISTTIHRRMEKGATFAEAISQDIYMTDNHGNEIREDKKGRKLAPIRHVRCKVAAGRGYMTREKSLEIRQHNHFSKKQKANLTNRDYKKMVYAQNDSNYLFLLYEGIKRGALIRKCRFINTFEVANIIRTRRFDNFEKELWNEPYYQSFSESGIEYKLSAILKAGTRVLLWDKTPDEIYDLSRIELLKRLYVVVKFNNAGSDFLYLRHHLSAKSDIDIKLVPNKMNCLIEGRDFTIDVLGNISFIE